MPTSWLGHALTQDILSLRPEGNWLYQSHPPHTHTRSSGGCKATTPALGSLQWVASGGPLHRAPKILWDLELPGSGAGSQRSMHCLCDTTGPPSSGICLAKAPGTPRRFREFSCCYNEAQLYPTSNNVPLSSGPHSLQQQIYMLPKFDVLFSFSSCQKCLIVWLEGLPKGIHSKQ